jgi:hypothetical protein
MTEIKLIKSFKKVIEVTGAIVEQRNKTSHIYFDKGWFFI